MSQGLNRRQLLGGGTLAAAWAAGGGGAQALAATANDRGTVNGAERRHSNPGAITAAPLQSPGHWGDDPILNHLRPRPGAMASLPVNPGLIVRAIDERITGQGVFR